MTTISKTEYNDVTKTVSIWNYHLDDNGGIISSEKVMDTPIAPWADKYAVGGLLIHLALDTKRWEFGR